MRRWVGVGPGVGRGARGGPLGLEARWGGAIAIQHRNPRRAGFRTLVVFTLWVPEAFTQVRECHPTLWMDLEFFRQAAERAE